MALDHTARCIFMSRRDRLTTCFLLEKPRLSTEPPSMHSETENASTWKPRVLGPGGQYSPIAHGRVRHNLSAPLHQGRSDRYKTIPHFCRCLHLPTIPKSILYSTFNTLLFLYLFVLPSTPPTLFLSILYLVMVSTRAKNKTAHPAAPVMTNAAKRKAGIDVKQPPKKVSTAQTVRELLARINALENPQGKSFSKEPLVRIFTIPHIPWTLTTLSF